MIRPLSQPIRALLDADLRMIEADGELRQLHIRAGGGDEDPLAVAPIANLARQAMRFKSKLSRQVTVFDGEQRLALWLDVERTDAGVLLNITSWRALSGVPKMAGIAARALQPDSSPLGEAIVLQLDSALIIRGHSAISPALAEDCPLGQGFTTAFIVEDEDAPATQPLLSAVAERMAFTDKPVTARQSRRTYRLSGQPLWDAERSFAGYACDLQLANGAPAIVPMGSGAGALHHGNFGRELAPVLRQPVGRIIANAETIASKMRGALREGYADYAGDIAQAARHLQSLIDDMTDLEAVESATFRPAADPIDLADVARRVAGLMSVKASDHHIRLTAPDEGASVPATGEFRRVLQVALNLVGNAIRYSPDGSTVEIRAAREGNMAVLRVIDQGAGIAEADWDRIFAKFERLGRHDDGGSGLGLYISRRIATALGGALVVEASGPDGSTFKLTLPAR